jgi:Protein of unknown function (DUF3421)
LLEGFNEGLLNGNIQVFIGRRESDYTPGRLQISPKAQAGVFVLDNQTAIEEFTNEFDQFLVRNLNNTYKWVSSSNGAPVTNAITLQKSCQFPTSYVGKIVIDGNTFIGRVLPGKELEFIDANKRKRTSAHYQVLTCKSPDEFVESSCTGSWIISKYCPVKVKDSCSTKLV